MGFGGGYLYRPVTNRSQQWGWTTQPAQPDAAEPSGTLSFPLTAPGTRRTSPTSYDVSLHVVTVTIVSAPPGASPVFPDRAPGARRTANASYQAIVSATPVPAQNLGRYRLGDTVELTYQANPGIVSAPVATITGPNGIVDQPVLATRGSYLFTLSEFTNETFPLGNYTVNVSGDLYTFTLVAGGDPAGGVIAMAYTKNVQGHQVLVQTQRGELILGTNPDVSG